MSNVEVVVYPGYFNTAEEIQELKADFAKFGNIIKIENGGVYQQRGIVVEIPEDKVDSFWEYWAGSKDISVINAHKANAETAADVLDSWIVV